jgi:hypothetical protein
MITRILLIGPSRINEAAVTLTFDNYINPKPDVTYIISPYPQHKIDSMFAEYGINTSAYTLLDDLYFDDYYDLSAWKHDHWFYQQALKLCAIDHFDSDYYLIQDCDQVLLKPFTWLENNNLVLRAEHLWNPYQKIYVEMITKITGILQTVEYSLVNEIMPFTREYWADLKRQIEERNQCTWLQAIERIRPFDEHKWLSEYELLGMYITANTSNWSVSPTHLQPHIDTWEEFYAYDWSQNQSMKFLTQPLKYMNVESAKTVIKQIKDLTKSNN